MPPPFKPAPLLLLEKGVIYDEQRDRVANEPKADRDLVPKCPKHLSREQRREWKLFADALHNYGLLNCANEKHLEMIAIYSAAWRACLDQINETGMIVEQKKRMVMNPLLYSLDRISDQIRKCSDKLGLSSTGLAQLGSLISKAKKKEVIEEFMD
jgi:P27 family predicted phage terminase small subunit